MKKKYLKKLKREDRDLFELLPGFTCNTSCVFCSINSRKRKIDSKTNDLLSVIYQARKDGFKYLGIGGGEPTIRKDLVKLIRFAKEIKFEVVRIETNGIMLSYFNYAKKLVDAGLDFVKISIHGHRSDIHDYLTQVPGSFKLVLKAIKNLQRLNVRVEINTVITKKNYKHYLEFVDFFSMLGVGSFCFIYPVYSGRMAKNWKRDGVTMSEASQFLKKAIDRVEELELDKGIVFNIPPCCLYDHKDRMVETSPFNTKVSAPDATTESIDFNRTNDKIKFKQCKKCAEFDSCEGVWSEYVKYFGDKEFKPI